MEDLVNVSKNIKRLRSAKKLTQEQLAETLNVTRQTVSSWENDRTQPDIGMLAALAAALDTDIEDLIYGKRKHVGLEAPPSANSKRTLSLVLSIFGVLLTAAGLIFMFVYFWQSLPGLMRTVLSLLPLAVGAGAGIYVVLAKKESVPAREGAAVLWCAGVVASNALVNGLFHVDLGFTNLLLADMLLLLPVMFLLDSVFAFTAGVGMSAVFVMTKLNTLAHGELPWIALGAAVFAVCCVYVFKNGQIQPVKQYCAWVALVGAGFYFSVLAGYLAEFETMTVWMTVYAYLLALYIAERTRIFSLQLKVPALCALCAVTFGAATILLMDKYNDFEIKMRPLIVGLAFAAAFLALAVIPGRGTYRKNGLKIAFTALFGSFFLWMCFAGHMPQLLALGFSAAVGVLVVIAGVKKERMLVANLGMLLLTADLVIVLNEMVGSDFLWFGAVLLVCGVVFLLANRRMMKTFKKNKEAAAEENKTPLPEMPEADGNEDS